MKLCTFEHNARPQAGIIRDTSLLPIAEINADAGTAIPEELLALIEADCLDELRDASAGIEATLPLGEVRLLLPYARPGKIWCIGLNYRSHAEDIDAVQPEEPGSFMKPTSALLNPAGRSNCRRPSLLRTSTPRAS